METSFDKRAAEVKKTVLANTTEPSTSGEATPNKLSAKDVKNNILTDMREAVLQMDAMRAGSKDRKPIDISMTEYVKDRWGFAPGNNGAPDSFYHALGINPSEHSIETLYSMPEFNDGYRWVVPEIIRESVRTGLRKNPIYQNLIAGEETVNSPNVTMPEVKLSDASVRKIGEAESIPVGTVSFGQKQVRIEKLGIGLKITDEVRQFSSLNVLSIFLQDVGVKLGSGLDGLAIQALINGDQKDGSDAAAIVGTTAVGTWDYRSLLRAWIRMGTLGRMPQAIVSGEEPALDILNLNEFKGFPGGSTQQKINVKTPVPASQDYYIHGAMVDPSQIMLVDATAALLKLNAMALRVESERIADKQVSGTYVTLMTGFATLFRDARLIVDNGLLYSANGFPTWMSADSVQNISYNSNL